MGVQTMFPPAAGKPLSQYAAATNLGPLKTGFGPFHGGAVALLRDNFTIPTWILIGCIIQVLITLALPRSFAAFPALAAISWGVLDVLLMSFGVKQNTWMRDVIVGKFSVGYPADGQSAAAECQPGLNGPGAVMILGTRSNSPMGMFAEGFKEIGDRFRDMVQQLENDKEISGFMGMSTWLGAGERAACSEYATISYWRSIEDIHQFALSPIHRDAWNWWNSTVEKHSNLGIMHEVFEIPKRNGFEGIYVNYHPTGLAATTRLVHSGEKESLQQWLNPIVDARRGVFRSSRGRMGSGDPSGSSNEKVVMDPYAEVRA